MWLVMWLINLLRGLLKRMLPSWQGVLRVATGIVFGVVLYYGALVPYVLDPGGWLAFLFTENRPSKNLLNGGILWGLVSWLWSTFPRKEWVLRLGRLQQEAFRVAGVMLSICVLLLMIELYLTHKARETATMSLGERRPPVR
jgi:hypothetical protein